MHRSTFKFHWRVLLLTEIALIVLHEKKIQLPEKNKLLDYLQFSLSRRFNSSINTKLFNKDLGSIDQSMTKNQAKMFDWIPVADTRGGHGVRSPPMLERTMTFCLKTIEINNDF